MIAALSLAGSEFIFEETRNYVMQRKAFGKTIADLQVHFLCVCLVFFCLRLLCVACFTFCLGSFFFSGLRECQEQTVQHKLAELKTEICVGRAFVDSCLQLHAEHRLDSATASMAKYW